MTRMLLWKRVWEELGLSPRLNLVGAIRRIPIPEVTIRGRNPISTTVHAVTEGKELERALENVTSVDLGEVVRETIDLAIASQSAVEGWRELFGDEYVDEQVKAVLAKNRDRGYYDVDKPRHWMDLKSGSYDHLREVEANGQD